MKVILVNETNSIFLSQIKTSEYTHYFITNKLKYNSYIVSTDNDKSLFYDSKLGNEYPIVEDNFCIKYNTDKLLIYN